MMMMMMMIIIIIIPIQFKTVVNLIPFTVTQGKRLTLTECGNDCKTTE